MSVLRVLHRGTLLALSKGDRKLPCREIRRVMKLLLFAHTPPPYHGQSYMTQLLLEGFGGDARNNKRSKNSPQRQTQVECYHVNSRLSKDVQDIARVRWVKLFLLLKFCGEAIGCRFRFGVRHFYYIPAPNLRPAVYRDWITMAICRPFFKTIIYHWHAVGLGDWITTEARPWERWISRLLLGRPTLSIVLGQFNRRDALQLESRRIEIVPNGIPDPCPAYDEKIRPRRLARATGRKKMLAGERLTPADLAEAGSDVDVFKVFFLSLCYGEKGLFDTVEAIALAARQLQEQNSPLKIKLSVAGKFFVESERREFEERIAKPDLRCNDEPLICYHGFVAGETKHGLFSESDCFCFPTYYSAESFGLVLIEAMAFGLPCVTTNWRTIPELFPAGYPGIVEPRSPDKIAAALLKFLSDDYDDSFRSRFSDHYTDARWVQNIQAALLTDE